MWICVIIVHIDQVLFGPSFLRCPLIHSCFHVADKFITNPLIADDVCCEKNVQSVYLKVL